MEIVCPSSSFRPQTFLPDHCCAATGERTDRRRTTLRRRSKSIISQIIGRDKSSTCLPEDVSNGGYILLTVLVQVPEGDQEGSSCTTDAQESWVCVQPDGGWGTARPGQADSGIRHVDRKTLWVLELPAPFGIFFLPYIYFGTLYST